MPHEGSLWDEPICSRPIVGCLGGRPLRSGWITRWLETQDQADLLRKREGKDESERVFLAPPEKFEAPAPLSVVQIDHTKVDVTVVDPTTRLPIGRPTLTLAIDVNSCTG
jgi:hypothetical protein